jgi:heme/copper-type cytochrome/quinol oxidase subunit 4
MLLPNGWDWGKTMAGANAGDAAAGEAMTARAAAMTWLGLVVLTVGATWLAGGGAGVRSALLIPIIIGLAAVKLAIILGSFMGTWRAPPWCNLGALAWVAVISAIIAALATGIAAW